MAKKLIIARIIGETPMSNESFPSEKKLVISTAMDVRIPQNTASSVISPVHTRSICGGQSTASGFSGISFNMLFSVISERVKKQNYCPHTDKYISKIKNRKIFE